MGTADPKKLASPRNEATDAFSKILEGMMGGGDAPGGGDLGSFIQKQFSMPGYAGPFSAGAESSQTSAMGTMDREAGKFYAPGGTSDTMVSALKSIMGEAAPEVGTDINQIRAAMDPARKVSLNRDLGQMEESFGMQGLSGSSSLYESGARAISDSTAGLDAALAGILPQLEQLKVQAKLGAGQNRLAAADQLSRGTGGMAQEQFNMGEGIRSIKDLDIQRQIADFLQQGSLFPMLLSFLSGTPQQPYGPSTLDTLLKIGQTGLMGAALIPSGGGSAAAAKK